MSWREIRWLVTRVALGAVVAWLIAMQIAVGRDDDLQSQQKPIQ